MPRHHRWSAEGFWTTPNAGPDATPSTRSCRGGMFSRDVPGQCVDATILIRPDQMLTRGRLGPHGPRFFNGGRAFVGRSVHRSRQPYITRPAVPPHRFLHRVEIAFLEEDCVMERLVCTWFGISSGGQSGEKTPSIAFDGQSPMLTDACNAGSITHANGSRGLFASKPACEGARHVPAVRPEPSRRTSALSMADLPSAMERAEVGSPGSRTPERR